MAHPRALQRYTQMGVDYGPLAQCADIHFEKTSAGGKRQHVQQEASQEFLVELPRPAASHT